MKLLNARINWHEGYMNKASLVIMVDETPNFKDYIYRKHATEGLYYAELQGCVQFFAYSKPDRGYGGREFSIKVLNEDEVTFHTKVLKGPWSSRAGCMNHYGFGPCVDVSIGTLEANDNNLSTEFKAYIAGSITKDLAQQAVDTFLPNIEMWEEVEEGGCADTIWRFRRKGEHS